MILFVVPAYNEALSMGRLMEEVETFMVSRRLPYHLIIVDDGSTDDTSSIVARQTVPGKHTLISYRPNKGAAEAFRQGLNKALAMASDKDVIVTMEADGTSDLSILPALLEKIEAGVDVALASCYAKGGRMLGNPWYRIFLSRSVNLIISMVYSMKGVHTFSSFYRAYRPAALRTVLAHYGDFYEETTFACVVEILIRLSKLKMKMAEVPMVMRGSRRIGKSKMKIGRTILGHLRLMRRIKLSK